MTDREKLIELLKVPIYPLVGSDPEEVVADYLLDNGVTFVPRTDLTGKCGNCIFAKRTSYCGSDAYVECINEELNMRRSRMENKYAAVRQRTTKACKRYVPKE